MPCNTDLYFDVYMSSNVECDMEIYICQKLKWQLTYVINIIIVDHPDCNNKNYCCYYYFYYYCFWFLWHCFNYFWHCFGLFFQSHSRSPKCLPKIAGAEFLCRSDALPITQCHCLNASSMHIWRITFVIQVNLVIPFCLTHPQPWQFSAAVRSSKACRWHLFAVWSMYGEIVPAFAFSRDLGIPLDIASTVARSTRWSGTPVEKTTDVCEWS